MPDPPLFNRQEFAGLFEIMHRDRFNQYNTYWVAKTAVVASAEDAWGDGHGMSPDSPFATLVYAESKASAGDTIYVLPGHTETLASATGAVVMLLNTAGLKVIGLGGRTRKPALLVDGHANNYISITGADTLLRNVAIKAGHSDVASGVIVAGDGVWIDKCTFEDNGANENFLEAITDAGANTADRLMVTDCEFQTTDTSGTACIQLDSAHDRVIIQRNLCMGDYGTAAISIAGAITLGLIDSNLIENTATDNDSCINVSATSTGICTRNAVGNGAAQANQNTATAMALAENYGAVSTEDQSAILDPVITTAGD